MFCFIWLTKLLMIHKTIKNINKLTHIKYCEPMSKSSIKYKKLLVDEMVKAFKSIPASAITFSNIKKN